MILTLIRIPYQHVDLNILILTTFIVNYTPITDTSMYIIIIMNTFLLLLPRYISITFIISSSSS